MSEPSWRGEACTQPEGARDVAICSSATCRLFSFCCFPLDLVSTMVGSGTWVAQVRCFDAAWKVNHFWAHPIKGRMEEEKETIETLLKENFIEPNSNSVNANQTQRPASGIYSLAPGLPRAQTGALLWLCHSQHTRLVTCTLHLLLFLSGHPTILVFPKFISLYKWTAPSLV